MKCPSCRHENADDAKFCNECGCKLSIVCPACSRINPPASKFCQECGRNFFLLSESIDTALSFEEKLERIQRYLPQGLTERILLKRDKIEGERKQVTVMFADMEGFTSLVEKIGPEEAYKRMDQVYEILIQRVHAYGGTINEMTGDGIMALFGAPIALEDAPQRAIRSAYAIHREMVQVSEKMRQENDALSPLKMRIGIHTGPVVVGTLGNDLRVEFKAVGQTVNLASRMETIAEAGSTYVTEDTFKLTEGLFRFEALGEKRVKGKGGPVRAYKVIAPNRRRTRFDVSAERGLTPFIGREKEIELLADGFQRAKQGRGQAFSIVSEAGVGKSRLLYEFRKYVANENVTFLEGKCLSYSSSIIYHPVIDIIKANYDVQDEDSPETIRRKLQSGLAALKIAPQTVLPFLLDILSVEDSRLNPASMSPQARKDGVIQALIRIVEHGSRIRPLIIAIEDLHWIDKSSEDVLKYLLDALPQLSVLLLFTYRLEYKQTWNPGPYHRKINLNRLSSRDCSAMVDFLLGGKSIDRSIKDLIVEKSEGVPFFLEEIVKSLKPEDANGDPSDKFDLTAHLQGTAIPSNIQDIIMTRIDSLPPGAKEVLQIGAVIEREFSFRLIETVSGMPEQDLLYCLEVLKNRELITERGVFPRSVYIFKHALTREVAYDSILKEKRNRLHQKIGEAIEQLYENAIEEYSDIVSRHFIQSGNYEKGAHYLKLAARKAERASAFRHAIVHTEGRVACLEKLAGAPGIQKRIINARCALGFYLFRMNYMVEARAAIDPIHEATLASGYRRKLPLIYTILGTYYFAVEENFSKAITLLQKALELSQETEDFVFSFYANLFLGVALSWNCEFDKSSEYIQKALDAVTVFNISWNISAMKSNLSYYSYNHQGKVSLGYDTSREAVDISEESSDIYSKAIAYTTHGISTFYKGYFGDAETCLLKGADFSERIELYSYFAVAYQYLGYVYFELQRYADSLAAYKKAIESRKYNQLVPSGLNMSVVASARSEVFESGDEPDLEVLARCVNENRVKIYAGTLSRFLGEIMLRIGGELVASAENHIRKAADTDRRNGMQWHLASDYAAYADYCMQIGDVAGADSNLERAQTLYATCGAEGWLKHLRTKRTAGHQKLSPN